MVLQYIRSHGRITRSEAADLCQISSDQARYLLERLLRKGLIQRLSDRRTAFYELGDAP